MTRADIGWSVTAEVWLRFQTRPYGIHDEKVALGHFSPPCQYQSTNAPFIFIHVPLTVPNVSN